MAKVRAQVIMAKCSRTQKSFGIRIEERGRNWEYTWAFPMDERAAQNEGYSSSSKVTLGDNDEAYPGCPHCGSKEIVKCGCNKIGCAGGVRTHGNTMEYTCPWCGQNIELQHADEFDVSSGGF